MSGVINAPQVKNLRFHDMSFSQIDEIRKDIRNGKLRLYINATQLLLYLNQMDRKYSFILRWVQNISIISVIGSVILIFFNWRLSALLFLAFLVTSFAQSGLAMRFIRKQCLEDRVFLKFALVTELARITKRNEPLNNPIYKEKSLAN